MLAFISSPARADASLMSAPVAYERSLSGDLVVLDIRTHEEWEETGIAKGALPISMHKRDFLERLQSVLFQYEPEKIALICATGGRSAEVTHFLKTNGLDGIVDVSEGMLGNRSGPGWVARGLPLISYKQALVNYETLQRSWDE